jgi:Spy/CpxP family protein refolding chaperone
MPAAAKIPGTKIQSGPSASAILPLVLVFLCGVTVGALTMNLSVHESLHRTLVPADTRNAMTVERWKKELSLTDDQSKQIELILDDFSKYYDNVLADGNTRILQILNEQQRQKFQKILKERR